MPASPIFRLAAATAAAVTLALLAAVPEIGGISTWKIVLGAIGLALFVAGGRQKTR
jgi:hypothetical protein